MSWSIVEKFINPAEDSLIIHKIYFVQIVQSKEVIYADVELLLCLSSQFHYCSSAVLIETDFFRKFLNEHYI